MKNYETTYTLVETLFLTLLGAIFLVNNRHMLSRSLIADNKHLVKSWYIRSIGKVYPKYRESIPVVRPSFARPSPIVRPSAYQASRKRKILSNQHKTNLNQRKTISTLTTKDPPSEICVKKIKERALKISGCIKLAV